MDRRREHHIDRDDAASQPNGGIAYRRNLLATLREHRLPASAANWPRRRGCRSAPLPMVRLSPANSLVLCSYRAASSPWSSRATSSPLSRGGPVIDRQLGKEVSGIVQGGSVSWQVGRQRGLGL
ncbi:hypothetical protein Swit_3388 [Rhizorhabdus wittichii RW1]|uniref:DUF3363 domain-containing protein n=1 Tax=Rhizorhabdus wittichii (strain DSM 6014 / CCUG 31198 / JCM 15750 / NBRC 105917 / EY 4224 / RW1) TaxID=392499 RepID=A0A9J9HDP7_RHIWR|nr:hypothetical protein Swit_3388 [Rhizorhabdus wittichii RW1]